MTLRETMAALTAGGAVLGGIMSFLFEQFQWFQNLTGKARFWTIGVLSVGLPVLAVALVQYVPVEWWAFLEPFWQAAFAGGAAWLGSQILHKFMNKGGRIMAQQGMGSAKEILSRCLGDLGDDNSGEAYIDMVRRVGLTSVKTDADDLTDSQLNSLHVLINDDIIFGHVKAIHERYPELKEEFDLSAYPWFN